MRQINIKKYKMVMDIKLFNKMKVIIRNLQINGKINKITNHWNFSIKIKMVRFFKTIIKPISMIN